MKLKSTIFFYSIILTFSYFSKAYQKWIAANGKEKLLPGIKYNQDQIFFMSIGMTWCTKQRDADLLSQILTDVHSPPEFRYYFDL